MKESIEIAEKISNNSPLAIRYALQSIISGINTPYLESFDIENNYFSSLFTSFDCKEGITAFLDKRKPKFKGK